nr:uncharacterized protein LOC127303951 [Lolium perenne]
MSSKSHGKGKMKKKSAADSTIFTMWGKASKAKKIDERSTPSQPESSLQLVLFQAPDAGLEPESSGANPVPIMVDNEEIDEDDDEPTQADLGALEHDPGKRIPISRDGRFTNLKSIIELSAMLVETNKHQQYFLVYKLLKLVLILPVATASVERVFSSMNYVKNKLRNKMSDEYLNNALVTFVERDFFSQVKDEDVIKIFQQGDRRVTW